MASDQKLSFWLSDCPIKKHVKITFASDFRGANDREHHKTLKIAIFFLFWTRELSKKYHVYIDFEIDFEGPLQCKVSLQYWTIRLYLFQSETMGLLTKHFKT